MAETRAREYGKIRLATSKAPTTSLDPMTTAKVVHADKKARQVVGENDELPTLADFCRYANVVKANDVDVAVVMALDHGHNLVFFALVTFDILGELISNY